MTVPLADPDHDVAALGNTELKIDAIQEMGKSNMHLLYFGCAKLTRDRVDAHSTVSLAWNGTWEDEFCKVSKVNSRLLLYGHVMRTLTHLMSLSPSLV